MRVKALTLLLLLLPAFALAQQPLVYGASEQGRELVCHRVGSPDAPYAILLVFGVHGFEDTYDHDGERLAEVARALIEHYEAQPQTMGEYALYIIPSANPDGLAAGATADGFGRCNADGIDINRDFPVGWQKRTDVRNLTGDEPLSTAEARALTQLVTQLSPTYAVDVHGWASGVYGNKQLATAFHRAFSFPHYQIRSGGMLFQWLDVVTRGAVLVEMPIMPRRAGYLENVTERFIRALDSIMKEQP